MMANASSSGAEMATVSGDDDNESVNYVSTDDGFESGSDDVFVATPNHSGSGSESADLIDLSDFIEAPTPMITIDWNAPLLVHAAAEVQRRDLPKAEEMDLSSHPQAKNGLDPESPPFTPRNKTSFGRDSNSLSGHSSYSDARQSLHSQDDEIIWLCERIKQLEYSHETLKRENDSLDTVNEELKHKVEENEHSIAKLREDIAESELLRTRAQSTAVEQSENSDKLCVELARLREAYDDVAPQLEEYKKKLLGALQSNKPLHDQVQYYQGELLNATERVKEIEYFARNHLAKNPQNVMAFASVGLTPDGKSGQLDLATQIEAEAEALISFDGAADGQVIPVAEVENESQHEGIKTERVCPLQEDDAVSHNSFYDPPSTPPTPTSHVVEHQKATGVTEASSANTSGLKWSQDSDQLWISDFQKAQAIRSHQGARSVTQTPGMFIHGIRFVRQHGRQKLTTDDGIPDVLSRRVIMSSLPNGVHIQRVLEHVRGGKILHARIITLGDGASRNNFACIEFTAAEDAMDFFRFTRRREFGFFVNDVSVRARMSLPATDSFPLNDHTQAKLSEGCTRCLSVTEFPVIHLQAVLGYAGMSRNYAEVITHFACLGDGSFEISFSDIRSAVSVREYILRSKHYGGARDGSSVSFKNDPCDAPVETLIVPFIPTHPTSDLTILNPEKAHLFMTEEERQLDGDMLMEEVVAAADPNDLDAFHEQDLRKNIVWEKEANWDGIPEYKAYDPDQRRVVPHQRDPLSGAIRTQYHGQWVLSPEESRKMWLYYNQDSSEPWTQKTTDLFYAATGEIDVRKNIVVDDGGLDGDADQSTGYEESPQVLNEASSSSACRTAAPSLPQVFRGYMSIDDSSQHTPVGVFVNNVGCNSPMVVPSLLDQDFNPGNIDFVPPTPVPPHKRVKNLGTSSGLPSPSLSAVDGDVGGPVHGISKAGFNRLTAKIAQNKTQSTKSTGKKPAFEPLFW